MNASAAAGLAVPLELAGLVLTAGHLDQRTTSALINEALADGGSQHQLAMMQASLAVVVARTYAAELGTLLACPDVLEQAAAAARAGTPETPAMANLDVEQVFAAIGRSVAKARG